MAKRGALDLELDALRARLDELEAVVAALLDDGDEPEETDDGA
jgi:hypothetical protein